MPGSELRHISIPPATSPLRSLSGLLRSTAIREFLDRGMTSGSLSRLEGGQGFPAKLMVCRPEMTGNRKPLLDTAFTI